MGIDGTLSERHLQYYLERARGGVSMLCIEPIPAHPTAWNTRAQLLPAHQGMVPQIRKFTDAIHAEGAAVMQQVFHIGQHADTENSERPAFGPSPNLSTKYNSASHEMSEAEIEDVIEGFVKSAVVLQECGFDGVEYNGGYDSLIPSFWSAATNRRTDKWGGSFENCLRFSVEILSRTRKAVGDNFLIGLTMTGDDITPGGQDIGDRQEIATWLDERGLMDYVAVKTGTYQDWTRVMPTFMYEGMVGAEAAAGIKSVLKHAKVQAESRIRTIRNAEKVLANGQADMVSLVRAQIADPDLVNKAKSGRSERIRECISCNQVCVGRRFRDYWFSCMINPSVGRETEMPSDHYTPAETSKSIVVVGAGPAGLETARVAAERGHRVTLFEQEQRIGGQFRLAATQPQRGEIAELLNGYYSGELARLGVDVRMGRSISSAEIAQLETDNLVIATGSEPAMTGQQRSLPTLHRVPGVEMENVFSVNQVLSERPRLGQHVILLDDIEGWMPAAGTVAFLGKQGHDVTVLMSSAIPMLSLANSTANGPLRKLWAEQGVEVVLSSVLLEWTGCAARIRDLISGDERMVAADALVLATPNRPKPLICGPMPDNLNVHHIGDCVAARTAAVAFYEGRELAMSL